LLHVAGADEQPEPDLQPAGHVAPVPQLDGSQVTSQAHDDAHATPAKQVCPPTHVTLQGLEPQVIDPVHDRPAKQLTLHDVASRQAIAAHA